LLLGGKLPAAPAVGPIEVRESATEFAGDAGAVDPPAAEPLLL
jgi:hypothetical protein